MITRNLTLNLAVGVLIVLLSACQTAEQPLKALEQQLQGVPEYAVVLRDMRADGNFFKRYFHQYEIVRPVQQANDSLTFERQITDWQQVPENFYEEKADYLGLTVLSKNAEGQVSTDQYPPGYQYVGDSRYGEWQNDNNGNSFWVFYGKYALMREIFGMALGGRVYRSDWDGYRRSRERSRPYIGRSRQFGTYGQKTRNSRPDFYQRRQVRDAARRKSFRDRVNSRTSRSRMSSTRRRSSRGFGK